MPGPTDPMGALGAMMAGLQQNLANMSAQAESSEVEGQAGGGLVRVTCTAGLDFRKVSIDPKAMADREMLEDLLIAALNDAARKGRSVMSAQAQDLMGGMGLPPGLLGDLMGR